MEPQSAGETVFTPPEAVRGMKSLNRALFSCSVHVPCLKVESRNVGTLTKSLKMSMLKVPRIKPVAELAQDDPAHKTHKLFLLDPRKYSKVSDFSPEEIETLRRFDVDVGDLSFYEIDLTYDNWTTPEILRAVLPADSEGVSSYSIIGHIAHLNLKPEVMEYKHLIGELILDKNRIIKTVVNKLNTIDNTFRNFQIELLAGEDNYITRTKENGCTFELDFSKVYWNPRLSTEHQRVVDCLKKGVVLYDVFAGIGPFTIPAAKKGVTVLANDLNPHSHTALVNNVKINKVGTGLVETFNLDGREFIRTALKQDLVCRLQGIAGKKEGNGCGENHKVVGETEVRHSDHGDESGTVDKPILDHQNESLQPEATNSDSNLVGRRSAQEDGGQVKHNISPSSDQASGIPPSMDSRNKQAQHKTIIVMNLPALALEFLDAFCHLLSDMPEDCRRDSQVLSHLPTVFCYCFSKSDNPEEDVRRRAEEILREKLPTDSSVRLVRNVAPNKEMVCLIFRLTPEVLFGTGSCDGEEDAKLLSAEAAQMTQGEPANKRMKAS